MEDVMVLLQKLASIILIVVIGYFITSKKTLGPHSKDVISALLNKIALPMMIFASYAQIKLTRETLSNSVYVVIAAALVYLVNYLYVNYAAKLFKLNPKERSVYINGGVHANTAFLAFPLLFAVYGTEGLFYGTIFYVVDNILLFSVGLKRLNHDSEKKAELAPVTISLIISFTLMLICNYINFDLSTTIFFSAANDIGQLTTPLAFLFIGMILYESDVKSLLANKPALNLIFVKMVIVPLLFISGFYLFNFDVRSLVVIVIIVQIMMPPYSSLLAMSYEYNQDVNMATSLVVLGHIAAIITIPSLFTLTKILFK